MEIKSFLLEENVDTTIDGEAINEWQGLVDQLCLTKQAELIVPGKSPIPFPILTEFESELYGDIFGNKTNYKDFSGEIIPLKALSLIALCEREKYFDKIEIWYSREVQDPIVIGRRYIDENDRIQEHNWRMQNHKICVWGQKIISIAQLLPIWIDYEKAKMKSHWQYQEKELNDKIERFKLQITAFK